MQGRWFGWRELFGGEDMGRTQRRHGRAIINEALLDRYRAEPHCWWCGVPVARCEPHHLLGRGQESWSRFDVPENLAALCLGCHHAHHAGQRPLTLDLIALVAVRLKTTQQAIRDYLDLLRWGKHAQNDEAGPRPGRVIPFDQRRRVPPDGAGAGPARRRAGLPADEGQVGEWETF